MFYYFDGYLGYFVLGYYLSKYDIKIKPVVSIIGIVTCMVLYTLFKMFLEDKNLNFGEVFGYLSVDSPILVILWWNLLKVISEKLRTSKQGLKNIIVELSNLSFGVYLAHILVMRYSLWQLKCIQDIDNYILQTGVVFILTIICTILLVFLLSRLPIGKSFIAYRKS